MSAPRRVRILRALVRPGLLAGCDRTLLFFCAIPAFLLGWPAGFASGNYLNMALGVAVFFFSVLGLQQLAKWDPMARDVVMRARLYEGRYAARARWDVAPTGVRRSS
jgi:type IV secretory pathway TrbD component